MTNVPPLRFTATGVEVPLESDVLAGVQADIDAAFGGGVNPDLRTPQGQLATSEAAIIADKNAQIAYLVGQMDPDAAAGSFQDAIGRIYFMDRIEGAPTVVQAVCSGGLGTIIPVGAQAQDTSGNNYICIQAGQIGVSGSITLPFANTQDGPIPCPANTLTKIYRIIPGWDSINNPVEGVPGNDVESREEFETRRQESVAANAHGSLPSVYAEVFEVDGVIDVYATENTTGATVPTGATNYPLVEHSLYVAAIGGSPDDIAAAIWRKKDIGCDYNGNTEVIVYDRDGYDAPYPSYVVKFEIPDPFPVKFRVEIVADPNLPADIVQQIKTTIVRAFFGTLPGSKRVRIGSLLVASRFVRFVQALDPNMAVLQIFVGTVTADQPSLLIGIDQAPTVSESDIDVVLV